MNKDQFFGDDGMIMFERKEAMGVSYENIHRPLQSIRKDKCSDRWVCTLPLLGGGAMYVWWPEAFTGVGLLERDLQEEHYGPQYMTKNG